MKLSKYITFIIFSLFVQTLTVAQCDKVGQVMASDVEGCALLIRLTNGDLIEPVNSHNYSLVVGELIQFDFESSITGLSCSSNQPIQLTCVQEPQETVDPNCTANFSWFLSPNANPVIAFDPVAESFGTYSFAWDFGDGNVSSEEFPNHQYTTSGNYEVCLTVTDGGDCVVSNCELVSYTTSTNTQTCDFGLDLDVSDLTVSGSIFSYVDYGPYQPQDISWFNHTTGELLSQDADFTHIFTNPAAAEVITAVFTVTYDDGTTCEGMICEPISLGNNIACEASFDYEILEDYTAQFTNTSVGNFTDAEWEIAGIVGEGNIFSYAIDLPDYYEICLNIHNDTGCEAVHCETIFLGTTEDLCDIEDCVYPGDANQDGISNYLDVLQIGLGYGMTGSAREEDFSETTWSPMPAANWGANINGIDYKHLDCNGDGEINEADLAVINQNYMPIISEITTTGHRHPNIWVEFLEESIIIDEDSPDQIEVLAQVMLGTSNVPISDLYGVAFQMSYPGELVVPHSIEVVYQSDDFLGEPNQVAGLYKDLGPFGLGKIEAAYSRKDHESISGYGKVALVKFIIDGDIIGGRSEVEHDFSININKVRLIDENGVEIDANVPSKPTTLKILNYLQNSTNNPEKKEKIHIYPNPVTDVLTIHLEYLEGERVDVFNTIGQLVQTQVMEATETQLMVSELPSGVYWIKVHTDKGAASQRIFVE